MIRLFHNYTKPAMESSEKIFFNADSRKSNTDGRRFSDEICENPRAIRENLRSEKVFQKSLMLKMYTYLEKGVTLLELAIGAAVLIVALVGLLAVFFRCLSLNENSRNLTLATYAVQEKLEEVRNTSFGAIYLTYNGGRFDPAGFRPEDAEGSISINNSNPNLLQVSIEVSWRESSNRVAGEDKNLNGLLDAGEDLNGNVQIDSPVRVVTLMAQR